MRILLDLFRRLSRSRPSTLLGELERDLLDPLRERIGTRLSSVVAYGSALPYLEDEEPPLLANLNVLVVVDAVDLPLTDELRGVLRSRDLEGLEVVLVAADELPRLAETFPLEALEMRERYRVLAGADPLATLEVPTRNLAHQLAVELQARRQALFRLLVSRGPTDAAVGRQLRAMAGGFAALGRQLLRLRGVAVSCSLEELLEALEQHMELPGRAAEAVRELQATREERRRPARAEKREILEAFLEAWECLRRAALGPFSPGGEQPSLPFEGEAG